MAKVEVRARARVQGRERAAEEVRRQHAGELSAGFDVARFSCPYGRDREAYRREWLAGFDEAWAHAARAGLLLSHGQVADRFVARIVRNAKAAVARERAGGVA